MPNLFRHVGGADGARPLLRETANAPSADATSRNEFGMTEWLRTRACTGEKRGAPPHKRKWGPAFPPAPTAPSFAFLRSCEPWSPCSGVAASSFQSLRTSGRLGGPSWDGPSRSSFPSGFSKRAIFHRFRRHTSGSVPRPEDRLPFPSVAVARFDLSAGPPGGFSASRSSFRPRTKALTISESSQADSILRSLWITGISGRLGGRLKISCARGRPARIT